MITLLKISGLWNSSRHMASEIYSDAQFPWLTQSSISALHYWERIFEAFVFSVEITFSKWPFQYNVKMPHTLAQKPVHSFSYIWDARDRSMSEIMQ